MIIGEADASVRTEFMWNGRMNLKQTGLNLWPYKNTFTALLDGVNNHAVDVSSPGSVTDVLQSPPWERHLTTRFDPAPPARPRSICLRLRTSAGRQHFPLGHRLTLTNVRPQLVWELTTRPPACDHNLLTATARTTVQPLSYACQKVTLNRIAGPMLCGVWDRL